MTAIHPRSGSARVYGRPAIHVRRIAAGALRVVVVHDHRWVAPLVADVLGGAGEVVGTTADGDVAVRLCEVYRPDVVVSGEVLDDGIVDSYLARLLRTGTRVVLLSEPLELARMLGLVELGVTGLVDMALSPDELGAALLGVARGGAVLPPELCAAITSEWRMARRTHGVVAGSGQLTPREVEILGAMVDGLATKAIGHLLGVSAKTVENHKTRVFAKLGVRTQAEAVSMVLDGRFDAQVVPLHAVDAGRTRR
ncbi:MAG TPA: response regulator transcription factor [Acidimicrobiales bacterium]|nr:response regulator transcription factor [Acidimicrobiales bacterium]